MIILILKCLRKAIKQHITAMVKTLSKHYLIFTQILNLCFKKMQLYKNYPKHFSTTKIDKHTVCGYSIFIKHAFDTKKSKPDCHRGKDCIKSFAKI